MRPGPGSLAPLAARLALPDEGGETGGYPDGAPTDGWLKEQISAYADDEGIDLTGTSTKAEMLTVIEEIEHG